jgi:hypothetical protein
VLAPVVLRAPPGPLGLGRPSGVVAGPCDAAISHSSLQVSCQGRPVGGRCLEHTKRTT